MIDLGNIHINRKEVYRYLGYRGVTPDGNVAEKIEDCIAEMIRVSDPRFTSRELILAERDDKIDFIEGSGSVVMSVESEGLARNLSGCERAIMMAVTIGIGVDRLIARANVTDVTGAAIYQAAGAAYVEECCDHINDEIIREADARGYGCRPRYSPGYGDFVLDHQRDFESALLMSKEIGISLSDSLLMTPSKSVTAVIGLYRRNEEDKIDGDTAGSVGDTDGMCDACETSDRCGYSRKQDMNDTGAER